MKRSLVLSTLLLLLFTIFASSQELLFEGGWQYYSLTPVNLTGESAIHIFPSSPNSDDLQYPIGSFSLNSAVVAELLNANQGTLEFWIRNNFPPASGTLHTVFHNESGSNQIWVYFFDTGFLIFRIYDKDGTSHIVLFDDSGWSIGETHHIVCTWDFKSDTMILYVDGAVADNTPSPALSSDSIDAIASNTQLGQDSTNVQVYNGLIYGRILDRPLTSAEVTALYAAGAGNLDSTVVTPDVRWMPLFSDEVTGAIYWHKGATVSAIVDNGNDATLTTPANSDNRFPVDGEAVVVSDGTGYSKTAYMDGVGTDTAITVDDGAGSAVADIEKVGVSLDFDGIADYVNVGDPATLDFSTTPFTLEVWVKFDTFGVEYSIIDKETSTAQYYLSKTSGNLIRFFTWATTYGGQVYSSAVTDTLYHHILCVRDGINAYLYFDGALVDSDNSGNRDVDTTGNFVIGSTSSGLIRHVDGKIPEVRAYNIALTAADALWLATHPNPTEAEIIANTTVAATETVLYHNYRNQNLLDLTAHNNDGTHSGTPTYDTEAFVSRNRLVDGDMENASRAAWTTVGTPTTVDKESDTDSDTQSLHILSAADDDGVSQAIVASNGDKFYLNQRHKVTAGSFEVNVTNGGGGIETGISDASWTTLEKIISATGNLTFQWLGEAAADDLNISKATLMQCVAGDSLVADQYYTLVYNVDTTSTGAAETVLGSAATEVKTGDLYVAVDEVAASTGTKGSGYIPLTNPIYIGN